MNLKTFIACTTLLATGLTVGAQEKKSNPNPWFIQGQLGLSYSSGDAAFGKFIAKTHCIRM